MMSSLPAAPSRDQYPGQPPGWASAAPEPAAPGPARSGPARWATSLAAVGDGIDAFVSRSEARFSTIAARLQTALGDVQRLSADVSEAVGVLAAGRLDEAMRTLDERLAALPDFVAASDERLGGMLARLDGTAAALASLQATNRAFARFVGPLRAVAVQAHIQAVRLGEDGAAFVGLSQDVRRLAGDIATQAAAVSHAATGLADETAACGAALREARQGMRAELGSAAAGLRDAVTALDGHLRAARAVGERVAGHTAALADHVGAAVAASQYQDITRQRLEHVRDTLRLAADRLADDAETPADGPRIAARSGAVARLQRDQVVAAADDFVEAMCALGASVSSACAESAAAGRVLGDFGRADGQGSTALGEVDRAVRRIGAAVARAVSHGERVAETVAATLTIAGEMGRHVEDIDAGGEVLRLVALNAAVQSSQTGASGRALAVIARSVSDHSTLARELTRDVSDKLRATVREVETLERDAEAFSTAAHEDSDSVARDLAPVVEIVAAADAAFRSRSVDVHRGADAMTNAVERLTRELGVERELSALADRTRTALDGLLAEVDPAAAGAPPDDAWLAALGLDERYTMDAQRTIHAGDGHAGDAPAGAGPAGPLLFTASAADGDPAAAGHGEGDDEFGDNVELF